MFSKSRNVWVNGDSRSAPYMCVRKQASRSSFLIRMSVNVLMPLRTALRPACQSATLAFQILTVNGEHVALFVMAWFGYRSSTWICLYYITHGHFYHKSLNCTDYLFVSLRLQSYWFDYSNLHCSLTVITLLVTKPRHMLVPLLHHMLHSHRRLWQQVHTAASAVVVGD